MTVFWFDASSLMTSSTGRPSSPPCSLSISRQTSKPCRAALPGSENSPVSGSEAPTLTGSPPPPPPPPPPSSSSPQPAATSTAAVSRARTSQRSFCMRPLPLPDGLANVCCNRVQRMSREEPCQDGQPGEPGGSQEGPTAA